MKKRRFRWDILSALKRHQPFPALDNILDGQSFPRFALIKKRHSSQIRKVERAAKTKENKDVKY